ncbi:MAG: anthranilate phosphoribosyltransferase [Acidimicrobiales bacterium]|jgi:anthranilate phosphoribosyltransferase|nr:anthranilate phosphoribosyltransferase [Acidimicrobiales bacterium]MDP6298458.1 anthranilate phosphoribosyltransferase [Acidimicrobiales bacterium]HJM28072.1 anthranilate phosphoribosyltransferase [Acidimicrobiales bacterium]HJM97182.1 anthranilate phosphoribosyltransferase [Acidimicrobiales bacterium]
MPSKDFINWSVIIRELYDGHDLDIDTAESFLIAVLNGQVGDTELADFLLALNQKGETINEITGFVRAMRSSCLRLNCPPETIDLVGAGGSEMGRKAALNVSTIASFVAAGAGAKVCKHGNRRASSTSGSFDLLDELSITTDLQAGQVEKCVNEVGVGFAFARTFHPAMRFAGPVREKLGVPTVFNILGPLSHPAFLKRQVVGVPSIDRGKQMAEVLQNTGTEFAMVVTGDKGLDELSTTGANTIHLVTPEEITTTEISPKDVGIKEVEPEKLYGGTPADNAKIAFDILNGKEGPKSDIIVLNAAAGLMVAGIAEDLIDGIERSRASISSGAAQKCLTELVTLTESLGSK